MVKAGWVGFLPDNGAEVWDFFGRCAKIGYRGMDMDLSYASPGGDLGEKYRRLSDLGIVPLTVGMPCDFTAGLREAPEKMRMAKLQNITRATAYSSSISKSIREGVGACGTYDEMMRDFEGMNRLIPILEEEGIHLCYHNHFQEFTTFYRGAAAFEHMLIEVDERLKFDLDIGWVTVGGSDPALVLRRLEGRVACVHMKDFYDLHLPKKMVESDPASKKGFTSLGSGVVDIDGALAEMTRQGIGYACVEQDILRHLNEEEALTASYLRMKETGWVE